MSCRIRSFTSFASLQKTYNLSGSRTHARLYNNDSVPAFIGPYTEERRKIARFVYGTNNSTFPNKYEGWAKSSCTGAITFYRQMITKWFLVIYLYDVFLAQAGCFSMLPLCITNLRTFQHGHPGYLGARQKMSDLNDKSCFSWLRERQNQQK